MKNLAGEPRLSADAVTRLAEEGWCTVPDVITPEAAGRAVERLWATVEANAREGYSCFLPDIDLNPCNVRILNPIIADPLFRDLVEHPAALEAAGAVVGPDLILANYTANIARPGARSMALHSDLAFILPEPWLHPWSVNVIWCLTDAHPDNGATRYIPRSHLWHSRADVPGDAADRLVPFAAKAGSIVVMDGRIWHTSGPNVTPDEDRVLLFGYYSISFLRPMINWSAVIPAEVQAGLSPRLRQLLGLDAFANTSNVDEQGDWRGRPIGVDQALAHYQRIRRWKAPAALSSTRRAFAAPPASLASQIRPRALSTGSDPTADRAPSRACPGSAGDG